ncbi:MAG: methyltransferase domain-containing protein, partial [Bacteroidetes bacterium]|nr:methyltransferase domain-containing protein [Bacteroidota bacterium]
MVIFKQCIVCSSSNLKHLSQYNKDYLNLCTSCKFVFSIKKPTDEELEKCYQKYSRSNQISPITIRRYNELLDTLEKYRKSNNIIDVGSGDGYFLLEAKKRGWNVYGTEFEARAIENCVEKGIKMEKGVLNPENYDNEFFDVITSFEVVEH